MLEAAQNRQIIVTTFSTTVRRGKNIVKIAFTFFSMSKERLKMLSRVLTQPLAQIFGLAVTAVGKWLAM